METPIESVPASHFGKDFLNQLWFLKDYLNSPEVFEEINQAANNIRRIILAETDGSFDIADYHSNFNPQWLTNAEREAIRGACLGKQTELNSSIVRDETDGCADDFTEERRKKLKSLESGCKKLSIHLD